MFDFSSVYGNEEIIARLRKASGGKTAHAYIFSGEPGMGKKTLANAFAKLLECENQQPEGCGCLSCRVLKSSNHPDIHYVKGSGAKSIGVDDVRDQIIQPMNIKPFRYRYQVFIIDAAETLTPQAQNALLKTIEEPAGYGVFLFLAAHTHTLLPTVLSRCVLLKLKPLPDGLVRQALARRGVSDAAAGAYALAAGGNIGRALLFAASEDFAAQRELALDVVNNIQRRDINGVLAWFPHFEKWKDSIQSLLDILYLCYHNLLAEQPGGERLKQLLRHMEAVAQAKKTLRQNGNFQLAIELMLLKLREAIGYDGSGCAV